MSRRREERRGEAKAMTESNDEGAYSAYRGTIRGDESAGLIGLRVIPYYGETAPCSVPHTPLERPV